MEIDCGIAGGYALSLQLTVIKHALIFIINCLKFYLILRISFQLYYKKYESAN